MAAASVASSGARTILRLLIFCARAGNHAQGRRRRENDPAGMGIGLCAAKRSGEQAVIPDEEKRSPYCCSVSFRERRDKPLIENIPEKTFTEGISKLSESSSFRG